MCCVCRGDTPALYQVLPERRVGLTAGMMASTHVYDINAANPGLYPLHYNKSSKSKIVFSV
jgi:hypothetical protein